MTQFKLWVVFVWVLLCSSTLLASERYVSQVGAGSSGDLFLRTVFLLTNGGSGEGRATIRLRGGAVLLAASARLEGSQDADMTIREGEIEVLIPAGQIARLVLQSSGVPAFGWASLDEEGVNIDPLLQMAEGGQAEVAEQFENHLADEVELRPQPGHKRLHFPASIFLGREELRTAFSLSNLAEAVGTVTLRTKAAEKTITLGPGETVADFYLSFFDLAIPGVFPFKTLAIVEVESNVPLAAAALRTRNGRILAPVQIIGTAGTAAPLRVSMDSSFEMAVGDFVTLEGSDLTIEFWNVAEDSRCPIDVTCVWEGRAVVTLRVQQGSNPVQEVQLATLAVNGVPGSKSAEVGDFRITLEEVRPAPLTTEPLDISDYRITLKVEKIN